MSRTRNFLAILFSFVLLALLGWFTYYLLSQVLGVIQAAKPDSNLISVLITVFAGFVSLLIKQTLDRRDAIRQDLRSKKVQVYEAYMRFWFDLLHITRSGQIISQSARSAGSAQDVPEVPNEIQQQLVDLARQLILWGSVDVIKKHVALRKLGQPNRPFDTEKYRPLLVLEDALKAIRRDLGHSNTGLQPGDLIWLFVNEDQN